MKKIVFLLVAGLLLMSADGFAYVWPDDPNVGLGSLRNYLVDEYAIVIDDQIEAETFFQVTAEYASVIVREAGWAENEAFGWYREGNFENEIVPEGAFGTYYFDTGPGEFGFEIYGEFNPNYGWTAWYSERFRNIMHEEDPTLQHLLIFPNYQYDPDHPGDLAYRVRVPYSYVLCWEDQVRNPDSPRYTQCLKDFDDFVAEVGGITVVPEPGTLALLGMGLLGLGGAARLRRRK